MAEDQKVEVTAPQKTHAENIINKIVDLVPGVRSHVAAEYKKVHDEILKLIPVGAQAAAGLQSELEQAKAKIETMAKEIEGALTQVETLTKEAEAKANELMEAKTTIESLGKELEAAKAGPAQG